MRKLAVLAMLGLMFAGNLFAVKVAQCVWSEITVDAKLDCSNNLGKASLTELYAKGWRLITIIKHSERYYYIIER
ncbi:MAG: hypothetical protein LBQ52_06935 [Helicobacteraceae bacterium]|jgi:hypothetical protein|nr:hypothetical protein [Helicobacteraceae bacterium]